MNGKLIGIFFEPWLLGCVDANAAVWNADETNIEEKSSVLFSDAVAGEPVDQRVWQPVADAGAAPQPVGRALPWRPIGGPHNNTSGLRRGWPRRNCLVHRGLFQRPCYAEYARPPNHYRRIGLYLLR